MIKPKILYEDDNFLLLNKPPFILSEPTKKEEISIVSFLKKSFPSHQVFDPIRFGLVHRLDKETSGILIVAKNKFTFEYLKKLFKNRRILKEYFAIVYSWPKENKGTINFPIGLKGRKRTTGPQAKNKKEAITEYKLMRKFDTIEGKFSLLKIFPKTGRTNQIRVHLARIGIPIIGDRLYGRRRKIPNFLKTVQRTMLHAFALEFSFLNSRFRFEAELPEDMKILLGQLEKLELKKLAIEKK